MTEICRATLTLLRKDDEVPLHEMRCHRLAGHADRHQCGGLTWVDTIPGAVPHKIPAPRFQAHLWDDGEEWVVVDHGGTAEPMVATYDAHWHPMAQRSAEREAETLNQIDDSLDAPDPDGEGRSLDEWRARLQRDAPVRLLEAVHHFGAVKCNGPSTDSCLRCQIARTIGSEWDHIYPHDRTWTSPATRT